MKYISNAKGFTLIEMMIVVAIIGVLMLTAMPNYRTAAENAQIKSCTLNKKLIEAQTDLYYIEKNQFPEGLDSIGMLVTEGYLKTRPVCPAGGEYELIINLDKISVNCDKHP